MRRLRRAPAAVLGLSLAVAAVGCGADTVPRSAPQVSDAPTHLAAPTRPPTSPSPAVASTPDAQPPRGSRQILPGHRVVAYYGNAQSAAMGVLGETSPREAAARVEAAARPFATRERPVLPAFELIVTIADSAPGSDGTYSHPTEPEVIRPWIEAARRARLLVILDIQPGRARFLPEVRRYEQFLRLPHVGLALDSEWRMQSDEIPGQQIGQVEAAEINEVSAYLAQVVRRHRLPQKLLLVHQFRDDMVLQDEQIKPREGVALVHHVDGFGTRADKIAVYERLAVARPRFNGFKLFYDEDVDLFSPAEVLALRPSPDFVSYQ